MSADSSKGKDTPGARPARSAANSAATDDKETTSRGRNGARATMTDDSAATRSDIKKTDSDSGKPSRDETTQSLPRAAAAPAKRDSKRDSKDRPKPAAPAASSNSTRVSASPSPAPSTSPAASAPVMAPPSTGTPPGAGTPPRVGRSGTRQTADKAKEKSSGRSPRKAHLQLARFEPWSVMKFSFVMSLVCFVVLFVAVVVLYVILSTLGVFDSLESLFNDVANGENGQDSFDPNSWFSASRVFGYTALVGALNVLLITALATVWAVIYNMAADLVGGVEVTLKESE